MVNGTYKFCVIEVQKNISGLVVVSGGSIDHNATTRTPVWNILYSVPFDTTDEQSTANAFMACSAWIENNDNGTSQYIILDMFFYERKK